MDSASTPAASGPVTIRYTFGLPDGRRPSVVIQLSPDTLQQLPHPSPERPDWVRLPVHQCANCPLRVETNPDCPAALSLVEVMRLFSGAVSFDAVEVEIETEARRFRKRATLQQAVSSLVGLLMVTSGCPVLAKLRPMVRHHLPVATLDETRYRVLSMYLLAQYFLARRQQPADWELQQLVQLYESIHVVNQHFAKRLAEVAVGDASLNALIILDVFADAIAFTVDEQLLEELEQTFHAYLT